MPRPGVPWQRVARARSAFGNALPGPGVALATLCQRPGCPWRRVANARAQGVLGDACLARLGQRRGFFETVQPFHLGGGEPPGREPHRLCQRCRSGLSGAASPAAWGAATRRTAAGGAATRRTAVAAASSTAARGILHESPPGRPADRGVCRTRGARFIRWAGTPDATRGSRYQSRARLIEPAMATGTV